MMRRGPSGPRSLCNACGLYWANRVGVLSKRIYFWKNVLVGLYFVVFNVCIHLTNVYTHAYPSPFLHCIEICKFILLYHVYEFFAGSWFLNTEYSVFLILFSLNVHNSVSFASFSSFFCVCFLVWKYLRAQSVWLLLMFSNVLGEYIIQ
jgi:hypothetical protein